jgi:hypothetical protein
MRGEQVGELEGAQARSACSMEHTAADTCGTPLPAMGPGPPPPGLAPSGTAPRCTLHVNLASTASPGNCVLTHARDTRAYLSYQGHDLVTDVRLGDQGGHLCVEVLSDGQVPLGQRRLRAQVQGLERTIAQRARHTSKEESY